MTALQKPNAKHMNTSNAILMTKHACRTPSCEAAVSGNYVPPPPPPALSEHRHSMRMRIGAHEAVGNDDDEAVTSRGVLAH